MIELYIPFDNFIFTSKTYLTSDLALGVTSLLVDNTNGFSVDDMIVLGTLGQENAEVLRVVAVPDDLTLTVTTTKFAHSDNEPVAVIQYDQIIVYSSTSKDGTYTKIVNPTHNISFDSPQGTFVEDSAGSSSWYYKFVYKNSRTLETTKLTDSKVYQGEPSDHYTSIYEVMVEAGMEDNQYLNWKIVDEYRREAEDIVNGYIKSRYVLPLTKVPEVINRVTTLFGACYLLKREYGDTTPKAETIGLDKCKTAQDLIDDIADGKIDLLDPDDGSILDPSNTDTLSGYPNNSAPEDEKRIFKISDKY
jgi:phage gp36-like protein